MPKIKYATIIHEANHAIAAMVRGFAPIAIDVSEDSEDSPYVAIPRDVPDFDGAIIAFAGALGVDRLLGDNATEQDVRFSKSDMEMMARMNGYGTPQAVLNAVRSAADQAVGCNRGAILDLTNALLRNPKMSTADLGALVRRTESMKAFRHLFAPQKPAATKSVNARAVRSPQRSTAKAKFDPLAPPKYTYCPKTKRVYPYVPPGS